MIDRFKISLEASEFRRKFKYDDYSPINLFDLISNMDDITLIETKLPENTSGMFIRISDDSSIIVINNNLTLARKHFSIGHELYHYLHEDKKGSSVSTKDLENNKDKEKEADLFASYLILPELALNDAWNDKKEKDITIKLLKIEHLYKISRMALLIRLRESGYITRSVVDKYCYNVIESAKMNGFSTELYEFGKDETKVTGRYIKLVNDLSNNNIINEEKKNELLKDAFFRKDFDKKVLID